MSEIDQLKAERDLLLILAASLYKRSIHPFEADQRPSVRSKASDPPPPWAVEKVKAELARRLAKQEAP
jgi:hypothetical protein